MAGLMGYIAHGREEEKSGGIRGIGADTQVSGGTTCMRIAQIEAVEPIVEVDQSWNERRQMSNLRFSANY